MFIVCRCRRFDPSLSRLRQRALAGEVGKLQILKSCSRDSALPSEWYIANSGLSATFFIHRCAYCLQPSITMVLASVKEARWANLVFANVIYFFLVRERSA